MNNGSILIGQNVILTTGDIYGMWFCNDVGCIWQPWKNELAIVLTRKDSGKNNHILDNNLKPHLIMFNNNQLILITLRYILVRKLRITWIEWKSILCQPFLYVTSIRVWRWETVSDRAASGISDYKCLVNLTCSGFAKTYWKYAKTEFSDDWPEWRINWLKTYQYELFFPSFQLNVKIWLSFKAFLHQGLSLPLMGLAFSDLFITIAG